MKYASQLFAILFLVCLALFIAGIVVSPDFRAAEFQQIEQATP